MGTAFALGFVASTTSSESLMDKSRSVRQEAIAGESRYALCSRIQLYQRKYQRRNETPNVRTARRTNAIPTSFTAREVRLVPDLSGRKEDVIHSR